MCRAAGFIEGEGSMGFYGRGIRFTASQVQRWPLEHLKVLFGGNINLVNGGGRGRYRGTPIFTWGVYGARAAGALMMLYQFLSPRRQEQTRVALAGWRSMPPAARYRETCKRGHAREFGAIRCHQCSLAWKRKWNSKHQERYQ